MGRDHKSASTARITMENGYVETRVAASWGRRTLAGTDGFCAPLMPICLCGPVRRSCAPAGGNNPTVTLLLWGVGDACQFLIVLSQFLVVINFFPHRFLLSCSKHIDAAIIPICQLWPVIAACQQHGDVVGAVVAGFF